MYFHHNISFNKLLSYESYNNKKNNSCKYYIFEKSENCGRRCDFCLSAAFKSTLKLMFYAQKIPEVYGFGDLSFGDLITLSF